MDRLFASPFDDSLEVLDNATIDSTTSLATTSSISVTRTVSATMVASIGLAVMGIGCCANSVVLAVLIRARREFGSSVHTLITNQSTIDLFACVVGMITLIMMIAHDYQYNGNEVLDGAICVLFEGMFLAGFAMTVEIAGIIVITVERYFKIVHAIAHRKYYRDWMTKLGVALPWIFATCMVLLPGCGTTRIVNGRCLRFGVWTNEAMKQVSLHIFLFEIQYYVNVRCGSTLEQGGDECPKGAIHILYNAKMSYF